MSIVASLFRPYRLDSMVNAVPNMMYLGIYRSESVCDRCLCVYFKAPHSYTGEDVVELQLHGGAGLVSCILADLVRAGARPADRGEFTKRAFYNGKLSLTEAEGIAEMINADSAAAVRAAFRTHSGMLDRRIEKLKESVLNAIAYAESGLDDPDANETDALEGMIAEIQRTLIDAREVVDRSNAISYVKNGIRIGIIGKTNRGKSSLLNAICARDRAIVTDIAGTTRDTLEESIDYKGVRLIFVDTAGIRQSDDVIERIGVDRTIDAAKSADALILVLENGTVADAEELELISTFSHKPIIVAFNKSDVCEVDMTVPEGCVTAVKVSAKNGSGVGELISAVYDAVAQVTDAGADLILNTRQLDNLKQAIRVLENALDGVQNTTLDCTLVDLYQVLGILSELDGSEVSDIVVDKVFSTFCTGK